MKKYLILLGSITLGCLILFGCFFLWVAVYGQRYDKESKAYTEKVIWKVATGWDEKAMLDESSPEMIDAVEKEKIGFSRLFRDCKEKLGPIKSITESKGEAHIDVNITKGIKTTANYVSKIVCQKGEAEISSRLIYRNGGWKFLILGIGTNRLLP